MAALPARRIAVWALVGRQWSRVHPCGPLLALSITQLCACATPLSDAECSALLDRYTERLLRSENPDVSQLEVAEKQAQARRLAQDNPRFEFEKCAAQVSRSQFECAMHANDVDTIEQCLVM